MNTSRAGGSKAGGVIVNSLSLMILIDPAVNVASIVPVPASRTGAHFAYT